MWLEVTDDDKIIYGLYAGELLPNVDMLDGVRITCDNEVGFQDQTDILVTLNSIHNRRLRVCLETDIPFKDLTPIVRHYIDNYYNTNTNECKEKSEVWTNVLSE